MHANTPNHEQSMRLMNCGDERLSRPSMGSWLTYGMGTENANLPGFIAMCPGLPVADVANWKSAFLPGVYQGTYIDTRKRPRRGPDREHPQHQRDPRRPAPAARPARRPEPDAPEAAGRGRRARGANRQLRAGLPHADGRHRRLRRRPGAAVRARRLRPRRPGPAAPDRAAGWSSGASGSSSSTTATSSPGTPTTTSPRTIARWPASAIRPSRRS